MLAIQAFLLFSTLFLLSGAGATPIPGNNNNEIDGVGGQLPAVLKKEEPLDLV
jgi:hypothetical protein